MSIWSNFIVNPFVIYLRIWVLKAMHFKFKIVIFTIDSCTHIRTSLGQNTKHKDVHAYTRKPIFRGAAGLFCPDPWPRETTNLMLFGL
jgi:hypothetical protein